MKSIYFLGIVIFNISFILGQNLVPNPDFETKVTCPSGLGSITSAANWGGANTATTDYFHNCYVSGFPFISLSTPNNAMGFQIPNSGVAYAGIVCNSVVNVSPLPPVEDNYRGYLQVELSAPLVAGESYSVDFLWNLSNKSTHYVENLGVHFSNTMINTSNNDALTLVPQVSVNGTPLNDTLNWNPFQETFIATGGEKYMIIGNFNDPANTVSGSTGIPLNIGTTAVNYAYYHIEDVSVERVFCFEIEKILVDACGPGADEGKNEMVTFIVGNQDLNTSNLTAAWTTANSFDGIVQNATTAQLTTAINNTIVSCGHLVEPTGGVLPAGSKVLLITSTVFDPTLHSFMNLNDTLIVIYHNSTTGSGNFGNYNSSGGTRTFSMSFSSPSGCSDVVSFERDQLVRQDRVTQGGENGAFVSFAPDGTASYDNLGCQVPAGILSIDISSDISAVCGGGTINLSAVVDGGSSNVTWSSTEGTFSSQGTLTSIMTVNNSVSNSFYIYGSLTSNCNTVLKDSVLISVSTVANVTISESNDTLCTGQNVVLTASGAASYVWNGGVSTANPYTITAGGIYTVVGSSSCGNDSESITIDEIAPPSPITVAPMSSCDSNEMHTVDLTSNVCESCIYTWSDGTIGQTYSGNVPNFSVSIENYCGTEVVNYNYTITTANVSISVSNDTLCTGQNVVLTATGAASYVWNGGASTANPYSIATGGTYTVVGTTSCGNDTADVFIKELYLGFSVQGDGILCDPNEIHVENLNPCEDCSYIWSDGTVGPNITTAEHNYSVTISNGCGTWTTSYGYDNNAVFASFEIAEDTLCPEGMAEFYNNSAGGITGYSWEFDNGVYSDSDSMVVNTFYENEGEYEVTLVVENVFCKDSVMKIVSVVNCNVQTEAIIPNVFTPNKDGQNDLFSIEIINGKDLTGAIFNRWGTKIKELNGLNATWDGGDYSAGTYYYIIEVQFLDDSKKEYTGHIQLMK